jgi:hypothetical protein
MHLQTSESLRPQITKRLDPQIANLQICKSASDLQYLRKVRKSNKLSPQICGFAICGTYLWTPTFAVGLKFQL